MAHSRIGPCHWARQPRCLPDGRGREAGRRLATGRGIATLGAAVGIALLPKCPICLTVYLGFFGALGWSATLGPRWVRPGLIAALIAGVAATGFDAGRRRGHGPCLIATCAAIAILVGKLMVRDPSLVIAGLAVLAVALFWDRWPVRIRSTLC